MTFAQSGMGSAPSPFRQEGGIVTTLQDSIHATDRLLARPQKGLSHDASTLRISPRAGHQLHGCLAITVAGLPPASRTHAQDAPGRQSPHRTPARPARHLPDQRTRPPVTRRTPPSRGLGAPPARGPRQPHTRATPPPAHLHHLRLDWSPNRQAVLRRRRRRSRQLPSTTQERLEQQIARSLRYRAEEQSGGQRGGVLRLILSSHLRPRLARVRSVVRTCPRSNPLVLPRPLRVVEHQHALIV
jgi:hypothetical protein